MESIQSCRIALQRLEDKFNIVSDEKAIDALIHARKALHGQIEMFRREQLEKYNNEKFLARLDKKEKWIDKLRRLIKCQYAIDAIKRKI